MASFWKERDVKKKVEVHSNKYNSELYSCPCCHSGDENVFTDTGDCYVDYPLRRCQNCGQLLDWSDTNWRDYY
jgi:hypothetical protein